MKNGYTPTQEAMLNVLADGFRHTREELYAVLPYELSRERVEGARNCLKQHLFNLRARLGLGGQTIVCEYYGGRYMYRWIRLLVQIDGGEG